MEGPGRSWMVMDGIFMTLDWHLTLLFVIKINSCVAG